MEDLFKTISFQTMNYFYEFCRVVEDIRLADYELSSLFLRHSLSGTQSD